MTLRVCANFILLLLAATSCNKPPSGPGFSAEELVGELEERKPTLISCYEGKHPLTVDVRAIVDAETGALTNIRVVGASNLQDCIVSKLQAWRFEPRPSSTPFTLPVYFEREKSQFDPQPVLVKAKTRFEECVSAEVKSVSIRFHLSAGGVDEATIVSGTTSPEQVACLEGVAKSLGFSGSGERRFVTKVSLFD